MAHIYSLKKATGAILALHLLLFACVAVAVEPPATDEALRYRAEDLQRIGQDVPVLPSTCDCLRYSFGHKDTSGRRTAQFTYGYNALDYSYNNNSDARKIPLKVPVQQK